MVPLARGVDEEDGGGNFFEESRGVLRTKGLRTAASARAQRDHRLMLQTANYASPQVTGAVRKLQRSGKRFAHRLAGHGCRRKFVW